MDLSNQLHEMGLFTTFRGSGLSLMLWAYFDDSGHFRQGSFLCLAGYMADAKGWAGFSREWGDLLRKHDVSALHMADMVALQGEFKPPHWSHEKNRAALPEFVSVIRRNLSAGFAVAVDLDALRALPTDAQKRIGDPYYLCFLRIVGMVINVLKRVGMREPIAVTFDDCEEYSIKCYRLLSRLRKENAEVKSLIGSISFADDEFFYPLQAADMLAYEAHKDQRQKAGGHKPREHYMDLAKQDPFGLEYESEIYDKEALEALGMTILARESQEPPSSNHG